MGGLGLSGIVARKWKLRAGIHKLLDELLGGGLGGASSVNLYGYFWSGHGDLY